MSSTSRAEALRRAEAALSALSDADDQRFRKAANADSDNPPLRDDELAGMGRSRLSGKVGEPVVIDSGIIEHFRSGGPGWQKRINDALRRLIEKA